MEIVCLQFREIEYFEDNAGTFNRYVIKDKNFEEKIEKLRNIIINYDNFQEIEDFIAENFTEINIEEIKIEY